MTSRGRRWVVAVCVLVACVGGVVAGCGAHGSPSTGSSAPPADTIDIKGFAFAPADLTVAPGTKVTVRNEDSATHTVTSSDGKAFDTGNVTSGATTTFTAPSKPGTYTYICHIHQYMQGTLTVK